MGKAKPVQGRRKKKGNKKIIDPFSKKDWYSVKAPAMFPTSEVGQTCATRSHGLKKSEVALKGRVVTAVLADLTDNPDHSFRKIKLRILDTQGTNCTTDICGVDFTRDKLCSLIRKGQTLIEGYVDGTTVDGYTLRAFCIGFTRRVYNQHRETNYAQSSQVKKIRLRMTDSMTHAITKNKFHSLVGKINNGELGKSIQKKCMATYPLQNVYIRKVKVLRAPKTLPKS